MKKKLSRYEHKKCKKKHKCNDDDKMCSNEISGDKIFFSLKKSCPSITRLLCTEETDQ